MRRITINLQEEERQALHTLAKQERRDIRSQAALMIRRELERIGLLATSEIKTEVYDAANN